jgi:hypothetical protein
MKSMILVRSASPVLSIGFGLSVILATACGGSTDDSSSTVDASVSGSGGQSGSAGGNGSGGNGQSGSGQAGTNEGGNAQGGNGQGGGSSGGAGMKADSGPTVACRDDGGKGLASAARQCAMDSDCQIVIDPTCCGADDAYGVAKTQVAAYASCVGLPPGACQGLGCAKFLGYFVDTGQMTSFVSGGNPMSQVAVHCTDKRCTTSVIPLDAGTD